MNRELIEVKGAVKLLKAAILAYLANVEVDSKAARVMRATLPMLDHLRQHCGKG